MLYSEISLINAKQKYLELKLTLKQYRFLAQIRLLNYNSYRICVDSSIYKFDEHQYCYRCSKNNNLMHMLIDCINFKNERIKLNMPLTDNQNLDLFGILENPNSKQINKLYALTKHVLYIFKSNM